MSHLPKLGDIVATHNENDDYGIDQHEVYRMIGSITDPTLGHEVYVLSLFVVSRRGRVMYLSPDAAQYITATHVDFEVTKQFGEIYQPAMRVFNASDKNIVRETHDKSYILVSMDVLNNAYSIILPEQSSDAVYKDIRKQLNETVTASTFTEYIDRKRSYLVRWKKDAYIWQIKG